MTQHDKGEGTGWKPIETAPKGDGFRSGPSILLGNAKSVWLGYWYAHRIVQNPRPYWCSVGGSSSRDRQRVPTHWMPLPPPPNEVPDP